MKIKSPKFQSVIIFAGIAYKSNKSPDVFCQNERKGAIARETIVGAYLRDAPLRQLRKLRRSSVPARQQSPRSAFRLSKGAPRRCAPTKITLQSAFLTTRKKFILHPINPKYISQKRIPIPRFFTSPRTLKLGVKRR